MPVVAGAFVACGNVLDCRCGPAKQAVYISGMLLYVAWTLLKALIKGDVLI